MGKSQGDHNQHDVRPTVAERLKLLREASGLSLRDLEKQLGTDGPSRSSIHRYEKGKAQPTAGHLKAYERFYGLEPGSLLSRDYEQLADVRGRMVVGRFIVSIMLVAVTAVVVWMAHSRSSSSSEPNMAPSIDRLETFSAPISASPQVLPSTGSAAPTIGLAAAPIPLTVGLRHPAEIAVDRTDGALIVVDTENDRVVRIDLARASFSVWPVPANVDTTAMVNRARRLNSTFRTV